MTKHISPKRKEELVDICDNYLRDNFHKFTEANKQKIALVISAKNVTQKVDSKNATEITVAQQDQEKELINEQIRLYRQGNN